MSAELPPREDGLEAVPLNYQGVVVGKVPVRGVGFRVGLQGGGRALLMSPARARRFAKDWRSPQAVAAGLDWIATALVEAADEIDAIPADEQRRRADQLWAMIDAGGTPQ